MNTITPAIVATQQTAIQHSALTNQNSEFYGAFAFVFFVVLYFLSIVGLIATYIEFSKQKRDGFKKGHWYVDKFSRYIFDVHSFIGLCSIVTFLFLSFIFLCVFLASAII